MERKICQEIAVNLKKIICDHKWQCAKDEEDHIEDLYEELERYANVLLGEFPLQDFKMEGF